MSKERLYAWESQFPHPMERLPPLSPLRSLFKSVKLDFVTLADPSNVSNPPNLLSLDPQTDKILQGADEYYFLPDY